MAHGYKSGGRQAGTPNKVTTAFKHAVQITYEAIGGHEAFAVWALDNKTDFYKIAARLIPTEIAAQNGTGVTVIIAPTDSQGRLIVDADYQQGQQLNYGQH
jgi:hypothetical protein